MYTSYRLIIGYGLRWSDLVEYLDLEKIKHYFSGSDQSSKELASLNSIREEGAARRLVPHLARVFEDDMIVWDQNAYGEVFIFHQPRHAWNTPLFIAESEDEAKASILNTLQRFCSRVIDDLDAPVGLHNEIGYIYEVGRTVLDPSKDYLDTEL